MAGVAVEWALAESLPRPMLNPTNIGVVLGNLIRNAAYALDERRRRNESGYRPVLTLGARALAEAVEIGVHDNGVGIPEAARAKLFTPFFTTKPTGQGIGLGLSLSFDIVTKLYRGALDITSVEGEFTLATIRLPLAASDGEEP
jgi:signal transduction histidine kinase